MIWAFLAGVVAGVLATMGWALMTRAGQLSQQEEERDAE